MSTPTLFPYGAITLSQICTAYGVSNNMGALRGLTYYHPDGTYAVVPQTEVNLRVFLGSANSASRIVQRTIIINYLGGSLNEIDSRTEMFYTATESDYVGFKNGSIREISGLEIMEYGGDLGAQNESVKLNVSKFMRNYRPMPEIKIKCYARRSDVGNSLEQNVKINCSVYDGGTTTLNANKIYENNSSSSIGTQVTRSITNTFPTTPSAILTYNIANNTLSIDLRRTIIIDYMGGTNINLDSQTEMFYTANESNYVGVSRDTGTLLGTSTDSIMSYSGNNSNNKSVMIDVNKFQTTYPSMTEIKFKCYARNNNSNKNATYYFNYMVYDNGINLLDSTNLYVNYYSNTYSSSSTTSYLPDEFLTHIILTYNIANNTFSLDLSENIKRTIKINYIGDNLDSQTKMYYTASQSYYVSFVSDSTYNLPANETSNDGIMRLIGENSPTDELVNIDVNKFKKMYPSMTQIKIECYAKKNNVDIGGFLVECAVYDNDTETSKLIDDANTLQTYLVGPITFIYNIATNSLTQTTSLYY